MLKLVAKSDAGRYQDLVFELLESYSGLRDNINQLYLACIMRIRGTKYIEETTLKEFFLNETDLPKVPSMASVIRLSTKLQKDNPHLRGKEWEKRQKHSKDYREDLGYGA